MNLGEPELRSLLSVATAQSHFLFNGSFYDQIDGVAVESPLAPVLANIWWGIMKNCGWKIIKALKCYFIADMLTTHFVYFTWNMMPLYFLTTSTLDTPTLG